MITWYKLEDNETKPVLCPFCGAPQRKYIPTDTVQIKCQYCGGIFSSPPVMGGETYRCVSHPERMAIGKCNDCGGNYCGACLHYYDLEADRVSATLYLCPNCLRKRHVEKADMGIYFGVLMLLFGVLLVAAFSIVVGMLFLIVGMGAVIYGYFSGRGAPEELSIDDVRVEDENRRIEFKASEGVDAEELYGKLLAQYVEHWGVSSGSELLESEIRAYTRRGMSFREAVEKVYRRQVKKQ